MAANIITFNKATAVGSAIVGALRKIREGREELARLRAVLIQMRDGDGSSAAHYDVMAAKGGYQAEDYADDNAAAKASFDELDSLCGKLTTDAEVDHVLAALDQCCAKHGL